VVGRIGLDNGLADRAHNLLAKACHDGCNEVPVP
jgi:hypothetical protein